MTNLFHFWLGEQGYGPLLANLRKGGDHVARHLKHCSSRFSPRIRSAFRSSASAPALAVTTKLSTAITMAIAVTFVTAGSNGVLSAVRRFIPSSIRMIVEMTIIASLVIVVDQFLKAYAYDLSKQLSVYVGLIITNCIVMGRAEAFAMKNGVWPECSRRTGQRTGI